MDTKLLAAALLALVPACVQEGETLELEAGDYTKVDANGKADSSVEAIFLDFAFEGQVVASSSFFVESAIEDQLLYTIGHLNQDNSLGRLDQVQLSNIRTASAGNGRVLVTYEATMPVAWGQRDNVPTTYDFALPRDISTAGQNAFATKYSHDCVDFGAHDVTSGNMWYYYRPERSGCSIADADLARFTADVSVSAINTTGKYPEYHKVWEDDVLNVVAVFGKYEDFATANTDAGISAYNSFTRSVGSMLRTNDLTTVPATVPSSPGVALPEVSFMATLDGGRSIQVTALLVDNIRTADSAFNARYAELTRDADLVAYNGHAGLGANVRALAGKGTWEQGQYAIVFINGCDTYAYIDSALADAHSDVNPDDPNGTKYLDIVTNAMPSFFHSMSGATLALMRGLMEVENPRTYEQMFVNIDDAEVVLVSGEQDNVFVPGFDGGGDDGGDDGASDWDGLSESGSVARNEEDRFVTPKLAAGRYMFEMSGTNDADLYVRTGAAPTSTTYECRPYKTGSDESCVVDLASDAEIHVMVRGYSSSSTYELSGEKL
jgi:hypothetical protein